jgi:macrolide transport system ATP-binding/permease protein
MGTLMQHLKFAARQLRRNPGFTVTVILTLALAIGANTAIFSLVNALMLKSLPYAHPERMGTIYARTTGPVFSEERTGIDGEKWELLRDNVPSLISAVFSGGISGVNLQAEGRAQYVHNARISAHYLDVLAIQPILGRSLSETEDRPHGPKSVVLSYSLWHNIFASDRSILGHTILLKGEPYTVVGILPEGVTTPLNADVYTPLQPSRSGEGSGTNFEAITRLRDGANWQQADAEINRAWAIRAQRAEKHSPGSHVAYYSVPLQKGVTDELRPQVLSLMLAAGFILLIACANLAGLALVRMLQRSGEIATRLALGASSWQVQKQLWIENLLLASLGGIFGLGTGFLALRGLLLLLPEHFLPVQHVPIDGRVMGFTLIVSLLTSVLFGMLPALATRRVDLRSSMSTRAVSAGTGLRLRQVLIAGEVALTVVLLAASGLLIRTLVHLETLPPGFNSQGVMTARASLDDARFHDQGSFLKLLDESTAAMRRIPGVQNAAVGLTLPYERALNDVVTLSDGKEAGQQDATDVVYVTPGYFETLRMPLLAGRAFRDADGTQTQHVAVVNRAFARKFFGGSSPIGRYIDKDTLIVGEIADINAPSGIYGGGAPLMSEQTMYVPATQFDPRTLSMVHIWFQPNWIVRTAGPVRGLTDQMQRALASVDANLPVSGFSNMSDLLAKTLSEQRIEVALLGAMSGLALLLSTVGIFALVANLVVQRKREIGIRIALGSSIRQAMVHVGRFGIAASAAGVLLGLVLCAGTLRAMSSVLYGIGAYDVPTIFSVILLLMCISLLAAVVPTLKIARIDPAKTLREE